MALTQLTGLIIANNPDLIYTHVGPDDNGMFAGWITMGEDDYCRPLLNTEAIFNSADAADAHMYGIRDECIKLFVDEE